MLDQMTFDQVVPGFSPLLTHPDFLPGVTEAEQHFPAFYAPAPLDLDEMIEEVETNLGRQISADENSFIYRLGYVYGIINTGLSTTILFSGLSALFNHPDFLSGVANAQECFPEYYAPAPLTEDEMICEVEANLGRAYQQSAAMTRENRLGHPSYIHHLGFVFGIINEGLTYTYTIG